MMEGATTLSLEERHRRFPRIAFSRKKETDYQTQLTATLYHGNELRLQVEHFKASTYTPNSLSRTYESEIGVPLTMLVETLKDLGFTVTQTMPDADSIDEATHASV